MGIRQSLREKAELPGTSCEGAKTFATQIKIESQDRLPFLAVGDLAQGLKPTMLWLHRHAQYKAVYGI